ncbi:MAG TPA: hypothetical protein VF202_13490, partial [Trueperaceae bacterium]
MKTLAYELAALVLAIRNCEKSGNLDWKEQHKDRLFELCRSHLPRGAGLDGSTFILLDRCTDSKLVFRTSFHHMNDAGMYDGWTDHIVTVHASFFEPRVTVSGPNKNEVKDDIAQRFLWTLMT